MMRTISMVVILSMGAYALPGVCSAPQKPNIEPHCKLLKIYAERYEKASSDAMKALLLSEMLMGLQSLEDEGVDVSKNKDRVVRTLAKQNARLRKSKLIAFKDKQTVALSRNKRGTLNRYVFDMKKLELRIIHEPMMQPVRVQEASMERAESRANEIGTIRVDGCVNVRSKPSKGMKVKACIHDGDPVRAYDVYRNGFQRVDYLGGSGWIVPRFIELKKRR